MAKYYNSDNLPPVINCPTGDGFQVVHKWTVNKDGVPVLVEAGKTNLYEFIQSHKDSCDINQILVRYKNGDLNALNARQALYADISSIPYYPEDIEKMVAGVKTLYENNEDLKASYEKFDDFIEAVKTGKIEIKKVGEQDAKLEDK